MKGVFSAFLQRALRHIQTCYVKSPFFQEKRKLVLSLHQFRCQQELCPKHFQTKLKPLPPPHLDSAHSEKGTSKADQCICPSKSKRSGQNSVSWSSLSINPYNTVTFPACSLPSFQIISLRLWLATDETSCLFQPCFISPQEEIESLRMKATEITCMQH